MHATVMSVQTAAPTESSPTQRALVGGLQVDVVRPLVAREHRREAIRVAAHATHVRLLARVDALVVDERRALREVFAARLAPVALLMAVRALMPPYVLAAREHAAADAA